MYTKQIRTQILDLSTKLSLRNRARFVTFKFNSIAHFSLTSASSSAFSETATRMSTTSATATSTSTSSRASSTTSTVTTASNSNPKSFVYFPSRANDLLHHRLEQAKYECIDLAVAALPLAVPAFHAFAEDSIRINVRQELFSKSVRASGSGRGEISVPCFTFNKKVDAQFQLPPPLMATKLAEAINSLLHQQRASLTSSSSSIPPLSCVERVESAAAYLNFFLTPSYLSTVLPVILDGSYLRPLSSHELNQPKMMIEYSQPNTHKAFHVGHMRNAALGDCFVRLYEQLGHQVVAANYFGDEGAHVAKCLWWLLRYMKKNPEFVLDSVPVEQQGEWLGSFYAQSVEQLDLSVLTRYPYAYVVPALVLQIDPHPDSTAPANWRVVRLQVSENDADVRTVVCGGMNYAVGDHVAYLPVGSVVKRNKVEAKILLGVASEGIIMSEKELGIEPDAQELQASNAANLTISTSTPSSSSSSPSKAAGKEKKSSNKDKAASSSSTASVLSDAATQRIHKFATSLPLGVAVTESGRLPDADIAPGLTVIQEHELRKQEVRDTLHAMESGDKKLVELWQKTRQWSLDEFKRIYAWLDCRFDHDFFESEVSEESRLMALEFKRRGVFIDSNGATGADLSAFGLGFCMVLKSDGTGLYATKDLALAKRKFEQFQIQSSIYIVDAAQTLHFKQVFKTLELMGYEQAKKCIHIPYGQVVLPSGKMSSRAGNVILFSQLRQQLNHDILNNFLNKYLNKPTAEQTAEDDALQNGSSSSSTWTKIVRQQIVWSEEDVLQAQRAIAVASIKYGMLNHDVAKDIVFELKEWTAKSGNTGPYMMYAYARIQSIIREVHSLYPHLIQKEIDTSLFALLTHESERTVLCQLHDFWNVIESCAVNFNASALCTYVFELSRGFSSWYDKCSLLNADNDRLRLARLHFITAIGAVIKHGLSLLGIHTIERM